MTHFMTIAAFWLVVAAVHGQPATAMEYGVDRPGQDYLNYDLDRPGPESLPQECDVSCLDFRARRRAGPAPEMLAEDRRPDRRPEWLLYIRRQITTTRCADAAPRAD